MRGYDIKAYGGGIMIRLDNISYSYRSPAGVTAALTGVTADIKPGITAIIGPTGSGKSTMSEIICGLTVPDSGTVTIDGRPVKEHYGRIGMTNQYPEYQLFAETVYEDIAYGPKNLGITGAELDKRIRAAAETVGLKKELLNTDPFRLSGGEKRLAALAGVLAMQPRVLVLDEPAAGLDPRGRRKVFSIIHSLAGTDPDMTVVFVTHSMDDAAEHADDIIVLDSGRVAAHGTPRDIFYSGTQSAAPEIVTLARLLKERGVSIGEPVKQAEAYAAVMQWIKGGDGYA